MNKIFLLLLLVACGVQAQIGGSPTGFNYGIKLPNATNEGDTLTVNSKIPIMNNDQVVNYFANVSDILAMGMSGLTPNRALISDGSGDLAVSAVTTTELSYVSGVTSALQTQLNSKLNSSSYTAADVLAKLLTVDGSGSGLDADLLRGVHWGNVNTNILTSGSLTGSDLTLTGGGNVLKLNGTSTGTTNTSFISFYENNGTTRQGYIGYGDGTNSHLYIRNEVSGNILLLRSTGELTYNNRAEFQGTVSGSDPVNNDDFVTKGYGDANYVTVETGTFTPTVTTSGATYSGSFSGNYTKSGDMVTCIVTLDNINTTGTPSGAFTIGNWPYLTSASNQGAVSISRFDGGNVNFYSIYGRFTTVSDALRFHAQTSLDNSIGNSALSITFTTGYIYLTATYIGGDTL